MEKTRTTLDQWITLQAVVDYGGFAQAAEVLHRTQSSISYTISKLEQILEIEIFSIEKRRAVLTKHGEQLLKLSREVTDKAVFLESQAKLLNEKKNNKINIVIDSLYQSDLLLNKIGRLIRGRRDYDVDFKRSAIDKSDIFTLKDVDLLVTHHHIESLNPIFLEEVEAVLVTHPNHRIQTCDESNVMKFLEKSTHIVLASSDKEVVKSIQTIYVANVEMAIRLTEDSVGYTWLPKNLISHELNSNALKEKRISDKNIHYNFYMYVNKSSTMMDVLKHYLIENE